MDFEAVSLATAPKKTREGTYSEELKAQVKEAWEAQQTLGEGYALQSTFGSQEERDLWLKVAQAYGKTQDLFVSKARAVVTEDHVLAFTVQVESVRQERIRERKRKAAENAALKAAGVELKPGRKPAGE